MKYSVGEINKLIKKGRGKLIEKCIYSLDDDLNIAFPPTLISLIIHNTQT